jgi:hypothetical protein
MKGHLPVSVRLQYLDLSDSANNSAMDDSFKDLLQGIRMAPPPLLHGTSLYVDAELQTVAAKD